MVDRGRIRVETVVSDKSTGAVERRIWQQRADFLASGKQDAHVVLDPYQGILSFGDGNQGCTAPSDAMVRVSYRATRGTEGNMALTTPRDRADAKRGTVLVNGKELPADLETSFPIPASGGSSGESLAEATTRAIRSMNNPQRCITLSDYERLAMETPGVKLARTKAIANLHPEFLCFHAPGMITLLVLPFLPKDRPAPSPALRRAVAAYLAPRRMLGTRVEIVGPQYVDVAVRARVRALANTDARQVSASIVQSINGFFHPLVGGPDGTGWPFGRDVYRSEVLQIIDESAGVDHVLSLELVDGAGKTSCGNVCVPLTALVAAGDHVIEIAPQT
jgi:predicted phage baseplate assembly protein